MQRIVRPETYKYVHPIFSEIEQFFAVTSEKVAQKTIVPKVWDESFDWLYDLLVMYGNFDGQFRFTDKRYKPIELPQYNDKNLILCFSGGKDSSACLKHYIESGYNVYLYHVPKINPSQNKDETNQSIAIAKYFDVPIYVEEIKISGKHEWVEHPMKNMIIASGALQYGIKNNIGTKIAFGNYTSSTLDTDSFDFCGGDDVEMWCAYEQIIQRIIPDFEVLIYLENALQTMSIVCSDKDLLNLTVSCLGRASLRNKNHNWIESKFNVKLPQYRCGQCYKCCAEYIYMVEHGLQQYSADYYLYCLNRLKANLDKERYIDKTTYEDVVERFMIDKNSKYLSNALSLVKRK